MQAKQLEEPRDQQQPKATRLKLRGQNFIGQKLRGVQESYEVMIKVMDQLLGECMYCALTMSGELGAEDRFGGTVHPYNECPSAMEDNCELGRYKQWREKVNFGLAKHCWECGLSQRICRRLERQEPEEQLLCEYPNIMLLGIFILY